MKFAKVPELEAHLGIDLTPFQIPRKRELLRNAVEPKVGASILADALLSLRP